MKLRTHQSQIVETMQHTTKGQILVPTGGGKTICMIVDAMNQMQSLWDYDKNTRRFTEPITTVVVAPRILLAQQLCDDFLSHSFDNVAVLHVHSAKTRHQTTTNSKEIYDFAVTNWKRHKLIFTTYHSLHRVQESKINVDTIYFDEAHNSTQKNFIESVEYYSMYAKRCYFFTATPKHSRTPLKAGMNDEDIYGKVIAQIPAPDLIRQGYIIPPKVSSCKYSNEMEQPERDKNVLLQILKTEDRMDKVLVTAKSTKDIASLLTRTSFQLECKEILGYSVMWITSKHGAIIDGKKVHRHTFFDTMNKWGDDPDKKFIMFHHSILSEGMNVRGLSACILMRNLDYITMAQTIGRVIRLHKEDANDIKHGIINAGDVDNYRKSFGKMFVPVYNNVGISTERRLQRVVNTIFDKGEAHVSHVTR